MKKFITSIALVFALTSCFAVMPKKIDFTAGLSSGIPIYGTTLVKDSMDAIDNPNRIIIGTFANVNLNPIKYATFFTGVDLLADFCWNSDVNINLLHFDIPLGVKFYPGLGGFDFGLAYTLGFCGFMFKDSTNEKHSDSTPWGNGFKLLAEYDFSRNGKSKYYPILGVTWNLMPRGSDKYDNIISLYIAEHF